MACRVCKRLPAAPRESQRFPGDHRGSQRFPEAPWSFRKLANGSRSFTPQGRRGARPTPSHSRSRPCMYCIRNASQHASHRGAARKPQTIYCIRHVSQHLATCQSNARQRVPLWFAQARIFKTINPRPDSLGGPSGVLCWARLRV
jgi:hypothetical protein